jgi:cation transport ATPase-like protein
VTFALQLVAVEVAGLASVLRLTPLGLREWVIVLLLAAATALVGQAIRLASRR